MTITNLANCVQTLQSTIVSILKANTTSLTFTHADDTTDTRSLSEMKIMDGVPTGLIKGTAFDYIIVHTPEMDSSRLTMTKHKTELTVHIEITGKMEGNVRILTDAVIDALKDAEPTTKASGYWWYGRRIRSNLNYTYLPQENNVAKAVWHMDIFLTYLWTGGNN
jgi:hypothetical protein